MKASIKAIDLIKRFEGFSSTPYLCPAGIPTIGYGSTIDTDGKPITMAHHAITEDMAKAIMQSALKGYEDAVSRYVKTSINQNQFDALVCFAYNVGSRNLRDSTLLRRVNRNQFLAAGREFKKWVYANGKKMNGLIKRREAESQLFASMP